MSNTTKDNPTAATLLPNTNSTQPLNQNKHHSDDNDSLSHHHSNMDNTRLSFIEPISINEEIQQQQQQDKGTNNKNKSNNDNNNDPFVNVEILEGNIINGTLLQTNTNNMSMRSVNNLIPTKSKTSIGGNNNILPVSTYDGKKFMVWTMRITLTYGNQQLYCYKRYSEFVVFRNKILHKLNMYYKEKQRQGNNSINRYTKIVIPELPPPVSWWKCWEYDRVNFDRHWLQHRQAGLEFFMCSVLLDKDIVNLCFDIIQKFILNKPIYA
ncbi:Ypt35p SCDLUD_003190 [Saccharomycodes ludwigii]|uniref:Ypt35p n=1 Tax=Saccharomycodes ludwigii TaxID=36035 RepID=UPI001E83AA1D|nr:hypothetical protein SCDLUD_003190 [Saccharomycodes ludwigii]KAH3900219.1 hypothetical protein SCDLUD_003190 [Saccharomycodes ludwigii]